MWIYFPGNVELYVFYLVSKAEEKEMIFVHSGLISIFILLRKVFCQDIRRIAPSTLINDKSESSRKNYRF